MNRLKKLLCSWFGWLCPSPPQPPNGPSRPGILYGYYGGGDALNTVAHCNVMHIGSWGDWVTPQGRATLIQSMIDQGHAALSAGYTKLIPTIDFCLFTPTSPKQVQPPEIAQPWLADFYNALVAAGLADKIVALYLIDEPNISENNLNSTQIAQAIHNTKAVWPTTPIAAIYGWNGNFAGVTMFDWVGWDDYGTGVGHYDSFISNLTPQQKVVLVPGPAAPWRENPYPFYDKAQQQERVVWVCPFQWALNLDGLKYQQQSLIDQYVDVGTKIKTAP